VLATLCVALIQAGYQVVILDNFSNSNPEVLKNLSLIIGFTPKFIQGDVRDGAILDKIFSENSISAVIHFAGLKAVSEFVKQPIEYYDNNVCGSVNLLLAMEKANIRTLIFSSSATVYGDPLEVPVREDFPLLPTNPYGRSKLIIENILGDLYESNPEWNIACLRYFNPVGAHLSGLIGENPVRLPQIILCHVNSV